MRTWTVAGNIVIGDRTKTAVTASDDTGTYVFGVPTPELARFIVDACNALEVWLASDEWPMFTVEERAAIADCGPATVEPDWAVALSPRGHAVMEDLAKYESMHPVHNSPSSPIDEVGDP